MNNVLSKRYEVLFSIPRGGVLGETLFFTYINDLLFSKITCKIFALANGTSLSYSAKNFTLLNNNVESDMKKCQMVW